MGGWLDFHDVRVKCTNCNTINVVTYSEDVDIDGTDYSGISSATKHCVICNSELFEKDIIWDENYPEEKQL